MEIALPADVATGVQRFLRDKGFDARSDAPLDRKPGLVRVSRTGGSPTSPKTETAQVLIEVWDVSQQASFELARRVWAAFAIVSQDHQEAFPGLLCYKATPSIPLCYPDANAPNLERHQFTVSMVVRFDRATIGEDGKITETTNQNQ